MKKITLFAAAMLMISSAFTACSSSSSEQNTAPADSTETAAVVEEAPAAAEVKGVVDLKDDDMFRPDKKVDAMTVLDFNATWCVPCKKLTPAFHQAADSFAGKVQFYSVDIDSLKATAAAFDVKNVPTVVIMTPDGTVKTFTGLDDFTKGATAAKGEELTATILSNLTAIINELSAK